MLSIFFKLLNCRDTLYNGSIFFFIICWTARLLTHPVQLFNINNIFNVFQVDEMCDLDADEEEKDDMVTTTTIRVSDEDEEVDVETVEAEEVVTIRVIREGGKDDKVIVLRGEHFIDKREDDDDEPPSKKIKTMDETNV